MFGLDSSVASESGMTLAFGGDTASLTEVHDESLPILLTQTLIIPESKTAEGILISAVTIPWHKILILLLSDPSQMYQIDPFTWEKIIAGTYKNAGWDEVIVTPRSGDLGRDIIATKKGIGSVRFIESVKRYKPGHLVTAEEVRSLGFVLEADKNASKGIVSTTSDFAPKIQEDPLIKPYLPHRIELLNRQKLLDRFTGWAKL